MYVLASTDTEKEQAYQICMRRGLPSDGALGDGRAVTKGAYMYAEDCRQRARWVTAVRNICHMHF